MDVRLSAMTCVARHPPNGAGEEKVFPFEQDRALNGV
jgi:hypothetical protein